MKIMKVEINEDNHELDLNMVRSDGGIPEKESSDGGGLVVQPEDKKREVKRIIQKAVNDHLVIHVQVGKEYQDKDRIQILCEDAAEKIIHLFSQPQQPIEPKMTKEDFNDIANGSDEQPIEQEDKLSAEEMEDKFNKWENLIPAPLNELLNDFAMDNTYPVRGVLRNLFKAASQFSREEDKLQTAIAERIKHLIQLEAEALKKLDGLPIGTERSWQWQFVNEIGYRKNELQRILNP